MEAPWLLASVLHVCSPVGCRSSAAGSRSLLSDQEVIRTDQRAMATAMVNGSSGPSTSDGNQQNIAMSSPGKQQAKPAAAGSKPDGSRKQASNTSDGNQKYDTL